MSKESTQLVDMETFDVSNMIFSDPIVSSIPDTTPAITYRRINISSRNDDGTVGELVLPTEEVYSFGVSENLDAKTKEVNGYVMPLCLFNKSGASDAEKRFVDVFNNIVEKCKDYLLENKEELELYDLEGRSDLKKLNPLYYKKDKGKIVEGAGPTLYAKLIVSKKQDKIVTVFFNENGEQINALDLLGKYCYASGAIKIESIFIGGGNKISLQVKLYECKVRVISMGMKQLLPRPKVTDDVVQQSSLLSSRKPVNEIKESPSIVDDDDDQGSIIDDDIVDDEPKIPTKKIIKKVIKKKKE
jgi:hypothetical protein